MKKGRKNYLLRIDEDVWNELNAWASEEFRSVNGQIELILRTAIEKHKGKSPEIKPGV